MVKQNMANSMSLFDTNILQHVSVENIHCFTIQWIKNKIGGETEAHTFLDEKEEFCPHSMTGVIPSGVFAMEGEEY